MLDFFNVKGFFETAPVGTPVLARIINRLIEAVNVKDVLLPKYLIVAVDQDILELLDYDNNDFSMNRVIVNDITRWLVRQINTILHRKRIDLLKKWPGAVSDAGTTVIFIHMLKRIGLFLSGYHADTPITIKAEASRKADSRIH